MLRSDAAPEAPASGEPASRWAVPLASAAFVPVYVCAVFLGNAQLPHRAAMRSFVEGIGWIAQIGLFVMLGLLATPSRVTLQATLVGVAAGLFLTFVARPLSVWLSLRWFKVPLREQVFLSWAGLRGAVPIVLATVPLADGIADRVRDQSARATIESEFTWSPSPSRKARQAQAASSGSPERAAYSRISRKPGHSLASFGPRGGVDAGGTARSGRHSRRRAGLGARA